MAVYDVDGNTVYSIYNANGNQMLQVYDVNGNPLMPTEPNFTVMSYNVQWFTGNNAYKAMHDEILDSYSPDVIGFQEFQTASGTTIPTKATEIYAPYYSISMGNYGNKNSLASKYAMIDFTTIPHATQTMDGQSYSTAHITFEDKDILLVVSHVTTSSYEATKVEQVREIFEAVQNIDRFIVMADFNTVCKSVNDTEYTTIMKQFVDAGYHLANCSNQHGFLDTWTSGNTASGTWYPCDHIITSANIGINAVIVDTTKIDVASQTGQSIDHLPIIAYLTVT